MSEDKKKLVLFCGQQTGKYKLRIYAEKGNEPRGWSAEFLCKVAASQLRCYAHEIPPGHLLRLQIIFNWSVALYAKMTS